MTARVRIRPGVKLGPEDLGGLTGDVLLADDDEFQVRLADGIALWFRAADLELLP